MFTGKIKCSKNMFINYQSFLNIITDIKRKYALMLLDIECERNGTNFFTDSIFDTNMGKYVPEQRIAFTFKYLPELGEKFIVILILDSRQNHEISVKVYTEDIEEFNKFYNYISNAVEIYQEVI